VIAVRRSLPIFLVAAVLAFLAAGCGGGGALALDPVASAATKTQQAGTYAFDLALRMQVAGKQLSLTGSGRADDTANTMQLTMDLQSLLPSSLTGNGTTADLVLANDVMYMRIPFLAGRLPAGKTWLKLDLSSLAHAGGGLGSLGQTDPQQYLQQLLASSKTQKVGTDTIQGEQMTHYTTTVDPASKLDAVPPSERAKVRQALTRLGMHAVPVDVWVDSQGLLRRLTVSLDFGKALQGASMTMTLDLHDFGTPVDIKAPSADQVFDATSLVQHTARP
jgi:LppX/LprAFG-like lipoprotein